MQSILLRLSLLIVLSLVSAKAQAGRVRDFSFGPIALLNGNLHIEEGSNTIQVQVIIDLGRFRNVTNALTKLGSIHGDNISIWVLADKGQTLHLNKKSPSDGHHVGGAGNAGSFSGNVTFNFDRLNNKEPVAIVLKIENEYQVFPILLSS